MSETRGAAAAGPAPASRGPVRRRRLHEDVAARIQELVAERGLRPGDRLPAERELMAEFGVGRSAVREAMLALRNAGVVEVSSGERARVAKPDAAAAVRELLAGAARHLLAQPGGAERLLDARVLLEEGLARLAAERAGDADLAMLAALLAADGRAAAAGDAAAAVRADVAFHYGLATVARNYIFTTLLEAVVGWLAERAGPAAATAAAREAAHAGHRRVYEAVAARDPEAAGRAMRAHLLEGAVPARPPV
jgi:GntR family transcriptional regulator, sialic acid-inducible nan operon repressor